MRKMRRFSPAWIRHNIQHARRRSDWHWRRATAGGRALPDFLIIGAMKGGTTSLYDYLCQHPKILGAFTKEVHYFDTDHYRGQRWYRAFFPTHGQIERAGPGAITGEATPYYLFHPACPQRIANLVPEAKLIVVLREPIDRAVSHYFHSQRIGMESRSMEQAFDEEAAVIAAESPKVMDDTYESDTHRMWSYLSRGHYAQQLRAYFELFPRSRMLILRSEMLFSDPQRVVDQTTEFLGMDRVKLTDFEVLNQGTYTKGKDPVSPALRAKLQDYFRPLNADLGELLGEDFSWGY